MGGSLWFNGRIRFGRSGRSDAELGPSERVCRWRHVSRDGSAAGWSGRRDDRGAPRHPDLRWSDGESTGRRAEPVPAGPRRQSRRLVSLGRGGLRRGTGTRRARAHLHRLRHLPLVPRDGPRELQRSGDRADPQRALRRGEGRPRGASRRRRQLPRRRLRVHARARLAAHGVRDPRRAGVLRRHVLPAAARSRRSGVRGGARRRRRGVARPASGSRRDGGGGRSRPSPRHPSHRPPATCPMRRDLDRAVAPSPRTRTGCTAGSGEPRSSRSPRCSTSSRTPARTAAALAERTLRLMGASPLRDPVEGGFFRYATRADWSEPHYERMLTDNALLLDVAAALAARDDPPALPAVARRRRDRVPPRADAAAERRIRERTGLGERDRRGAQRGRLLPTRRRRLAPGSTPPALDEKVLTGWNGLAIGALAHAGFVFDDAAGDRGGSPARPTSCSRTTCLADGTPVRASLDGVVSSAAADARGHRHARGRPARARGRHRRRLVRGDGAGAHRPARPRRRLPDATRAVRRALRAATRCSSLAASRFPTDPAEGATPSGITACADAAWRLFALGAGDRGTSSLAEAAMRGSPASRSSARSRSAGRSA